MCSHVVLCFECVWSGQGPPWRLYTQLLWVPAGGCVGLPSSQAGRYKADTCALLLSLAQAETNMAHAGRWHFETVLYRENQLKNLLGCHIDGLVQDCSTVSPWLMHWRYWCACLALNYRYVAKGVVEYKLIYYKSWVQAMACHLSNKI